MHTYDLVLAALLGVLSLFDHNLKHDTGVCKINACSKSTRHDSQTPFLQKINGLGGDGGEDYVMILPSRTGVYFANACIIVTSCF